MPSQPKLAITSYRIDCGCISGLTAADRDTAGPYEIR